MANPTFAPPPANTGTREHPEANTALILGIIGLLIPLIAPVALIVSIGKRREIAEGKYAPTGGVTAGFVLGIIGTIGLVLSIGCMVMAVSVYGGLVEETKWTEGKTAAWTIRQAMDVYKAKNSGDLSGLGTGKHKIADIANEIRLIPESFDNIKFFRDSDFTITVAADNSFVITVKSSKSDGPKGTYTLDSNGKESLK